MWASRMFNFLSPVRFAPAPRPRPRPFGSNELNGESRVANARGIWLLRRNFHFITNPPPPGTMKKVLYRPFIISVNSKGKLDIKEAYL